MKYGIVSETGLVKSVGYDNLLYERLIPEPRCTYKAGLAADDIATITSGVNITPLEEAQVTTSTLPEVVSGQSTRAEDVVLCAHNGRELISYPR